MVGEWMDIIAGKAGSCDYRGQKGNLLETLGQVTKFNDMVSLRRTPA
jgi:hypothetical protein